jgi:four helix bundle protein
MFHICCGKLSCSSYGSIKGSFHIKVSIVIEEADESEFWLEFIKDEKLMTEKKISSILTEAHELTSIVIITRRTAQKKGKTQS